MTTTAAAPRPRLVRRGPGARVGGVAAGIAEHTGRSPSAIRWAFVGSTLLFGFGAVLYAAYWIVLPADPAGQEVPRRRRVAQVVVVAGTVVIAVPLALSSTSFLVPVALACLGGAFLWRQADDTTRRSWSERSLSVVTAPAGDRAGRRRLGAGAALVVAAVVVALARVDVANLGTTLGVALVAIVGVALLTGPWWMRLVRELDTERRERIRSEERAELAARVHDSVLQTLALIQRRSESPREVARLARGQERELRALLWGEPTARTTTVSAALRAAAAEVEDGYGVAVEVVTVGDAPASEPGEALAAAAREALLNAAKHAGVDQVALYAEIEDHSAVVYVRDRGKGFDPAAVDEDRLGLRRSVAERIARHGGRSSVHSAPGEGTEVELEVALP